MPLHLDTPPLASITERLAPLGSQRWRVHFEARRRAEAGADMVELTIGEPDVPTPGALIDHAAQAMRAGRTRYSGGAGEPGMLSAVAAKYAARTGRNVTPDQVLAFPGTQAALAFVMLALVETGDAVLVPDPFYATYEGVVRAADAHFVPVAMEAGNGFRLTPDQVRAAIASAPARPRVLLLNSPHNPTGAVLSGHEIAALGAVAREHDLWIVSDEVYESLILDGTPFASPFDRADLADRTIVVSSLSKSHAAPGFRAGWAVGPAAAMAAIQGVSESFLFGGQPFIADMTERALTGHFDAAGTMRDAYRRRLDAFCHALQDNALLHPLRPQAGMFVLVDVSATGVDGETFAMEALDDGVATMPGASFGAGAAGFVRVSLTVGEGRLVEGARRLGRTARRLSSCT